MSILTIYNHGTGGSRSKSASDGEIVNIFGNNAIGVEGVDFLITEGVGSAGNPQSALHIQNNMTGVPREIPASPGKVRTTDLLHKVSGRVTGKILGKLPKEKMLQASGIGVDENVASVVNIITAMARANRKPTTINMIGWSRGAVTCIRIAHFLNLVPELAVIPINIFAVDPVAGQGHEDEIDAFEIAPNVRNYIATLAINENRPSFGPSDLGTLNFHRGTVYAILPLPGIHRDTASYRSSSGMITFHLCAKFLNFHGSPNHASPIYLMSERELLTQYALLTSKSKTAVTAFGGQSATKLMMLGGSPFGQARGVVGEMAADECFNVHQLALEQRSRTIQPMGQSNNSYLSQSMMRAILSNGLVMDRMQF